MPAAELKDAQRPLFEALRAWRAETARAHGVPAYVIFHDATLAAIAQSAPADLEALSQISGIGSKKLDAYGAQIIELCAATRLASMPD